VTMKPNRPHARRQERILSFTLVTHPASGVLRERFASAILTCDRSELRQILCEIAKISATSDSTDKFFRMMADVLIRTARCHPAASRKKLRNLPGEIEVKPGPNSVRHCHPVSMVEPVP